eukprot:m.147625 g.147625  ORF g.147625 m.147625 type:complete len:622 (-) comp30550_c0_seq1:77-1942(-)
MFAAYYYLVVVLLVIETQTHTTIAHQDRTGMDCVNGFVANSNASSPKCAGNFGSECFYQCDPGFLRIGKHVCQSYTPGGTQLSQPSSRYSSFGNPNLLRENPSSSFEKFDAPVAINQSFFGGECVPLCNNTPMECVDGMFPVRVNISTSRSSTPSTPTSTNWCLQTTCRTKSEALGNLTRGAYEVMAYGRNPRTGIYIDHVDPRLTPSQQAFKIGAVDTTAVGIVAECVAQALGYINQTTAQSRVELSLRSLLSLTPNFTLPRSATGGWYPIFIETDSGANLNPGTYATDSTGFIGVAVMFVRTYFVNTNPGSANTLAIMKLVDKLMQSVDWVKTFCTAGGTSSYNGTCVPWLTEDGDKCSGCNSPAPDGLYYFSELQWVFWLAYHAGCGADNATTCPNKPIATMWKTFQERRNHPDFSYAGQALVTLWPSYVTQLPFYLIHPFNSDPTYRKIFKSQWLAEWAYYNSSAFYAGEDGRYGLGAGPTPTWCADGVGYIADRMTNASNSQACRMYSAYAVAGYAPNDPATISTHLLQLLATGEAVVPIAEANDRTTAVVNKRNDQKSVWQVLWRKSLLERDPLIVCAWGATCGITLVDFASEFYGLASLQLGAEFFVKHTNHWD